MVPSKAAIAAFQFVEADLALSAAKKALRAAPKCTDDGSGEPDDDNRKCWQRRSVTPLDGFCDACQSREPLAVAVEKCAKVRKFARLRAIRAVRKEVTR
jgi:hypothetical protein